jgi:hypothetical protein
MKKILILILFGTTILSCSNDDNGGNSNNCDFETIVSAEQYENAPSDQLNINSLEINSNCLKINFSASGCDGNSWEVKLIDSEQIMESNPVQRNLRLSLKNNEDCTAVPSKTLTFDISELQILDDNQVYLNITNSDDQILYEY